MLHGNLFQFVSRVLKIQLRCYLIISSHLGLDPQRNSNYKGFKISFFWVLLEIFLANNDSGNHGREDEEEGIYVILSVFLFF